MEEKTIAVLIPCYNESKTIVKVINDFQRVLPNAAIVVYDNGSLDDTARLAALAGAQVRYVPLRGKGNVVRRMFADVASDLVVMVDGDATYDAESILPAIQRLINDNLDMVICIRKAENSHSFRMGHRFGNHLFNKTIQLLFGYLFQDVFSGYRVFSKRFVKSFPVVSEGFEIEAEMSIHALQLGLSFAEIPTPYRQRPQGSSSKLATINDGLRILRTILLLFMYIRPMALFGVLFLLMSVLALILGYPVVSYFIHTGLVPRIPTAILSASCGILAAVSLACGIVLDSVSRARLEAKRFWYLNA